jgi:hypothetical protein
VAERARLESVCTGNRTAGSNPALSAIGRRAMWDVHMRGSTCAASRRGRVRTREGWVRGWCAVERVWTRGGVGGWRDAGWSGRDRGCGGQGGGCVIREAGEVWCSRHPALSAIGRRAMWDVHMRGSACAASRRGRVRTREGRVCGRKDAGTDVVFRRGCGGDVHRGKQGARVPRDGAPRTSSGPEGSSDKGSATGAAVPPGSLLRHAETVVTRDSWPKDRNEVPFGPRTPGPGPRTRGRA